MNFVGQASLPVKPARLLQTFVVFATAKVYQPQWATAKAKPALHVPFGKLRQRAFGPFGKLRQRSRSLVELAETSLPKPGQARAPVSSNHRPLAPHRRSD